MPVNPDSTTDASGSRRIERLRQPGAAEQDARGYGHTLREICQQPRTWRDTAARLDADAGSLAAQLQPPPRAILLTGSGSSYYLCECLALTLQSALGLPVQAIPAGTLLTHWRGLLPPGPTLLVSFARSGDSPESGAVVDMLLAQAPDCRHLFVTCNADGRLATDYRDRATTLLLDARTNDRSLVMTSSFTNLFLAGRALGGQPLAGVADHAATVAERVLADDSDALAAIADTDFDSVLFLGSGVRFGAARESALKMLEMTGGRVQTLAETFLGLRHGPMSAVRAGTLVVAYLSADPVVRGFERDLLRELTRKDLGNRRVLVGPDAANDRQADSDLAIEADLDDADAPLIDVLVGQLLGFFRCLKEGFHPDAPSQGVLTRVVEGFSIHRDSARP